MASEYRSRVGPERLAGQGIKQHFLGFIQIKPGIDLLQIGCGEVDGSVLDEGVLMGQNVIGDHGQRAGSGGKIPVQIHVFRARPQFRCDSHGQQHSHDCKDGPNRDFLTFFLSRDHSFSSHLRLQYSIICAGL